MEQHATTEKVVGDLKISNAELNKKISEIDQETSLTKSDTVSKKLDIENVKQIF